MTMDRHIVYNLVESILSCSITLSVLLLERMTVPRAIFIEALLLISLYFKFAFAHWEFDGALTKTAENTNADGPTTVQMGAANVRCVFIEYVIQHINCSVLGVNGVREDTWRGMSLENKQPLISQANIWIPQDHIT